MTPKIDTIIFDLGGVLIDWNPRYLYNKIFKDEAKTAWFLENICTGDWNEKQDAGNTLQAATEELVALHPDWKNEITAYYDRWIEMLGGAIEETVEILRTLKKKNEVKLYALTNWSAETFPLALDRFEFLHWFDGIVVSGVEKTRKPFADFYHILLKRHDVVPDKTLFIDDNERNIKAAEAIGIHGIAFTSADKLKQELLDWGINV